MSDTRDVETLAEHGKHMAANMAEVFDISSRSGRSSWKASCRRGRRSIPIR
jgi:hypothetical protein